MQEGAGSDNKAIDILILLVLFELRNWLIDSIRKRDDSVSLWRVGPCPSNRPCQTRTFATSPGEQLCVSSRKVPFEDNPTARVWSRCEGTAPCSCLFIPWSFSWGGCLGSDHTFSCGSWLPWVEVWRSTYGKSSFRICRYELEQRGKAQFWCSRHRHRAVWALSGEWTPSGCCCLKECVHPQVACLQKWVFADREECLPYPGSWL